MPDVRDVKEVNAGGSVLCTRHKLRVAIGSEVGTTVENYDFIGYGNAAAPYFGTAFSRNSDPVAGRLAAGLVQRCCSASTAWWALIAALATPETYGPARRAETAALTRQALQAEQR
jgi:hypothetical protein